MSVTAGQETTGERWLVAARLSRMSKKDRTRPELITGIATQDQRSAEWASAEGHVIVHVTRDRNVSGAIAPWERPELGPWLTDPARIAQYDGIVAYEASRVSRDYADLPQLRKWAEQHGKKLYIIKERLRWPDNRDGMLWAVAAERSYQERQDAIERTKRELDALRAAGKLAGKYPWGYTSTGDKYDRQMIATPAGERYMPEVFTRITDGHKLPAVAEWLSGQTGRTFHPRMVAAMIRNTAYRGEYRTGRGKFVHECPALVSGELWRRAMAALDSRPSNRRGQRNDLTTGAALLSGLVYCASPECTAGPDSPMYKIRSRRGHGDVTVDYYRCAGRGAQRKGCGCMVPLAAADALMDQVMSPITRPVMRAIFHPAEGHQVEIDDITMKLRDLPLRDLDEDAEDSERARLRAERRRLADLPAKKAWTEYVPVLDDAGQPLTYGAKWAASDQAERRAWLRDAGFAVYLGGPDMVADANAGEDKHEDEVLSRTDVYVSDAAGLVFQWTGDEDEGLARGLA